MAQLREEMAKMQQDYEAKIELMGKHLVQEQNTSNNLIVSVQGFQQQIERYDEKQKKMKEQLSSREHLIKELENVINELTEQHKYDQNLINLF